MRYDCFFIRMQVGHHECLHITTINRTTARRRKSLDGYFISIKVNLCVGSYFFAPTLLVHANSFAITRAAQ